MFSLCGKLTDHLSAFGWLRLAVGFIKWRVKSFSTSWDEELNDVGLRSIAEYMAKKVLANDPTRIRWNVVSDNEASVWTDASSQAIGAAVSICGYGNENATWLRSDDERHF